LQECKDLYGTLFGAIHCAIIGRPQHWQGPAMAAKRAPKSSAAKKKTSTRKISPQKVKAKPKSSGAKKKAAVSNKKTPKKPTTKQNRGKPMSDKDKDQQALESLATDNSLETVRDILFGAQVKQANERDQQLEKLINTRADSLQKSLDSQMKAVENTIQKLTDKLAKDAEATATKVEQRFKQVEESIKSLTSNTEAQQQEMYNELVAERLALEKNAKTWNEDLAKELENVHEQLRESKTDRLTLANLLTDMAASLIADPQKKPQKK
jgi:hypothetical protein